MDYKEFYGATVNDALITAAQKIGTTRDKIDYEVLDEGSKGFLGIGARMAKIKVRYKTVEENTVKEEKKEAPKQVEKKEAAVKIEEKTKLEEKTETDSQPKAKEISFEKIEACARDFLNQMFHAMELEVEIKINCHEDTMDVEFIGNEMGILIGKRGQTLDSVQYLLSLVVNRYSENYIKVKVDTENYRQRRKETLEGLAKNIAFKVKRTKRPVSLEPMNPFERRVIHSALQNDRYVTTRSEGEEPYRHVVVLLKR